MQSGLLRHRIKLLQPVKTVNTYNEEVITFSEIARTWAAVRPLLGNEFLEERARGAQVSHRVQLRWSSDLAIEPTWRVEFKGRTLEVIAPPMNVDERGRELVLMCKELVS